MWLATKVDANLGGAGITIRAMRSALSLEEAAACPIADGGTSDGDGQMGLAGDGPADQHRAVLTGMQVAGPVECAEWH